MDGRSERKRQRLEHFGAGLLSKATIDRICAEPQTVEDEYITMYIEQARPRQRDADGVRIPKRQVKKALAEIRAELGYPDFRHKMWKGVI